MKKGYKDEAYRDNDRIGYSRTSHSFVKLLVPSYCLKRGRKTVKQVKAKEDE